MTTEASPSRAGMRGPLKAAVLILSLGEKAGSEVFKLLDTEEVKAISREITRLGAVQDETVHEVLSQGLERLAEGGVQLKGNLDFAKKVLESAFSPNVANMMIQDISVESEMASRGLTVIRKADPRLLSKLVQGENPQTIALVLSHMAPEPAAEAIGMLPEELRHDVCQRIAKLEQIAPELRDRVIETVASRLGDGGNLMVDSAGGVRKVAEILNRMDRNVSRSCLEMIENENPNLALEIRNLMFIFDDILLISDADMRKIIQRIDKQVLVKALKGTQEVLREHFYRNMSQRAVEMLKEDMEAVGPIKIKDAEDAQQEIVFTIRQMESEGVISIDGSAGEQYVL